ncbi:MAG TPA: hypothetical protein VFN09_03700 [Rhodanobacteraceae bacterium]|nr:hypothetical protein [Rhodanobacteraceae bacterium]
MHELCRAFVDVDLPLKPKLAEMLDEHFSHHTERRGCGLTQATRCLAERINLPRSPLAVQDLGLFDERQSQGVEAVAQSALAAGWAGGWRSLDRMPVDARRRLAPAKVVERLVELAARLDAVAAAIELPESQLIHGLIADLVGQPRATNDCASLPGMPDKPDIGSCSAAEEYFLEIAHGRVRRGGQVNVIADARGQPLLVEKMQLGESHSALSIQPIVMNGVRLPAGSLFALQRRDPDTAQPLPHGALLSLDCIEEARFLRFTTLAVAPEHRARAFKYQLEAQIRNDMFSPKVTTLDDMRGFVARMLAA